MIDCTFRIFCLFQDAEKGSPLNQSRLVELPPGEVAIPRWARGREGGGGGDSGGGGRDVRFYPSQGAPPPLLGIGGSI